MRWLLAPYGERRSYRLFLYLLLGLPLGVLDFVLLVTGFSLGLGLLVTLLGIPVLVGTLLVARALAALERRLAWSLADAPLPRVPRPQDDAPGMFWARLKELVTGRRTWSELAFLFLRLPLGTIGFVVAVTIVGLMFQWLVEMILVGVGVETQIGSWTIDTFGEALVYLPVGLLFLLVGPRLIVGCGELSARVATRMLGVVEPEELKRSVGDVLARRGPLDAFGIMDELEIRLGRGPFLTPTRVEATLVALEANGLVSAQRGGTRTTYTLA